MLDVRAGLIAVLLLVAATPAARAADPAPMPIFDAHLHYNWEPAPYYPLDKVLTLFRQQHIMGILATSRPNDGTRALYEAKPGDLWVVPFIRPYRVRADIQTWMDDPSIQELIETEYRRGYYVGIGEFHLSGQAAATKWVKRTVDFAVAKDLYLHAHADDERWDSYGSTMDDYRSWLAQLPRDAAEKIAFRNAERLFRR